jgi:hypothetical protein
MRKEPELTGMSDENFGKIEGLIRDNERLRQQMRAVQAQRSGLKESIPDFTETNKTQVGFKKMFEE